MDGLGYDTFWMAEHHFQPEGTECIPNLLMMAMHLVNQTRHLKIGCGFNVVPMWHPLRLAEDYAMADILSGGRVIFGVARGYHTREVETFGAPLTDRRPTARCSRKASTSSSRPSTRSVLPQGPVLHDPARGAVSRLHAEGNHPGAAAAAPAGRVLAADPERLGPRLRLHGQARHPGVIGGGSAEGGAVDRHMSGFRAAYARRGIKLELGERLCARLPVPYRREPRGGDARRRHGTMKRT